jgi:BlaI family transcriptional regulator, penicillinase repressor
MLTPLELDIMKAVWDDPPVTVKTVQAAIRPQRPLAYTTVMTIMHRLYQKGFLVRKLKSRAHVYEPAVPYSEVRNAEVDRLIDNFFAGSRENLIDFLDSESPNGNGSSPVQSVAAHDDLDDTLL